MTNMRQKKANGGQGTLKRWSIPSPIAARPSLSWAVRSRSAFTVPSASCSAGVSQLTPFSSRHLRRPRDPRPRNHSLQDRGARTPCLPFRNAATAVRGFTHVPVHSHAQRPSVRRALCPLPTPSADSSLGAARTCSSRPGREAGAVLEAGGPSR